METDLTASVFKTAGSLLLILGLIICLFYVLKRLRFGPAGTTGLSRMRVLTTMSLAPKRSIAIVEILDEWLVVGVGTDSVNLLTSVKRPNDPADEESGNDKAEEGFRSLLRSKVERAVSDRG